MNAILYIITHTISKDQGKWRKKQNKNWLQNHLWCPNDPRGSELDDDDNKVHIALCKRPNTLLYSTKKKVWHIGYTRHCHTFIVINTVIYLFIYLMFWVSLSINTYQKREFMSILSHQASNSSRSNVILFSFFFFFFFYVLSSQSVLFVCLFVCLLLFFCW